LGYFSFWLARLPRTAQIQARRCHSSARALRDLASAWSRATLFRSSSATSASRCSPTGISAEPNSVVSRNQKISQVTSINHKARTGRRQLTEAEKAQDSRFDKGALHAWPAIAARRAPPRFEPRAVSVSAKNSSRAYFADLPDSASQPASRPLFRRAPHSCFSLVTPLQCSTSSTRLWLPLPHVPFRRIPSAIQASERWTPIPPSYCGGTV
jgi:hypothetical protein